MSKSSYVVAAAIALAFSGASFANDPGAAKSGSSARSGAPASSAAAQCQNLSGSKKEQCMRQAEQNRGNSGSSTGATSGSGAGTAGKTPSQSNESAPSRGPTSGTAR